MPRLHAPDSSLQGSAFVGITGNFQWLRKYEIPRSSNMETQSLRNVMELMQHDKVVHLYGMSGSGKSQIVATVCEKLHKHPNRIVWHVQCGEAKGTLKFQWREFVRRLQQTGMISIQDERMMLIALNGGEMETFVNVLNQLHLSEPILLAVEDIVDEEERNIAKSMITSMESVDSSALNVRLLIATREKEPAYSEKTPSHGSYETYNVQGFTKQEAFDFLRTPDLQIKDEAKVMKLAEKLGYAPHGLFITKTYCKDHAIKYEEYYDSLEVSEVEEYRYKVIINLLSPKKDDEEKSIQFRVMQMMSFVSNNHIPTQLLNIFFQLSKPMTLKEQTDATSRLLERLLNDLDAVVWDNAGDEKSITLHGDVLGALNASMNLEERREVFADVVGAIGSLLDQRGRMSKHYLYSLKQHAEVVARHCNRHFDQLIYSDRLMGRDNRILLGLSKIYEVIGSAIAQHNGFREGNEEDECYRRAMEYIWAIVCANDGKLFLLACLSDKGVKEEDTRSLVSYEEGKDPVATAQEVFERMKKESTVNGEISEALKLDREKLFPVKEFHLADMEKQLGPDSGIDWKKMKQEAKNNDRLLEASVNQLEARAMIVPWNKFIEFYLAERMTSILHLRGRQDKYKGDIISAEMHVQCRWYVEFGLQLCEIIFQKTGVKTMFHYLLRANNQLPRLVRNRKEESDEEFLQQINKSRDIARSLVHEDADFYEHGIYKRIPGTAWTSMNALKYQVKANTKVHKRPSVAKDFPNSEADKECEELYELCKNNQDIVISTTCLVQAGKYWAARKEYARALETFESAFKWGIDQKLESNPANYGWALYNMGRAILAAQNNVENKQEYIKKFRERYLRTMNTDLPLKWKKLLEDYKKEPDLATSAENFQSQAPAIPHARKQLNFGEESSTASDVIGDELVRMMNENLTRPLCTAKVIGKSGGTIKLGGSELNYPTKAFDVDTAVSLKVKARERSLPEDCIAISPAIKCGTSNVQFKGYVTVKLPAHYKVEDENVIILSKKSRDSQWKEVNVDVSVSGLFVTFQVSHFCWIIAVVKSMIRYMTGKVLLQNFLFFNPATAAIQGLTCVSDDLVIEKCSEAYENGGFKKALVIPDDIELRRDEEMSYRLKCEVPNECQMQPNREVSYTGASFFSRKKEAFCFSLVPPPHAQNVCLEYILKRPNEEAKVSALQLQWDGGDRRIAGANADPTVPVLAVRVHENAENRYLAHFNDDTIYTIHRDRRKGKVLLINNDFNRTREGSEVDVRNMTELWTALGFEIVPGMNLSAQQMLDTCKRFADDAKDISVVVVIIMSHGGRTARCEEFFEGEDRQTILKESVLDIFSSTKSPHLQGIPKVFMFQACRGDRVAYDADEEPHYIQEAPDKPTNMADMLITFATQPGFVALRDTVTGSWLMNAITNVFMAHAHDKHVLDMLTMVNAAVSRKIAGDRAIQLSNQESFARRDLFLFPGWPIYR